MSARTRGDWILWGALGCTLVGTAHAEYTLATATGVHWFVAASVPGALDLYVIRALQVHRDVLAAVVAMVVMNVASHLVTAGVLPVHWGLISAVGALAPLVLWRIHYLWRLSTSALGAEGAPGEAASLAGAVPPDYIPEWVQSRDAADAPKGCVHGHPECTALDECGVYLKASAPVSLPAPIPHPVTDAPHPDVMQVLDSDRRNQGRTSMRALRAEYGWGQPRATDARKGADEYTRTRKEVQP